MKINTVTEYEYAKYNHANNQIIRKQMENDYKKDGVSEEMLGHLMASFNAMDADIEGEIKVYERENGIGIGNELGKSI